MKTPNASGSSNSVGSSGRSVSAPETTQAATIQSNPYRLRKSVWASRASPVSRIGGKQEIDRGVRLDGRIPLIEIGRRPLGACRPSRSGRSDRPAPDAPGRPGSAPGSPARAGLSSSSASARKARQPSRCGRCCGARRPWQPSTYYTPLSMISENRFPLPDRA